MEFDIQDELSRDGFVFYSVLYSTVTVIFAGAVLSKFLTNEFRFGFRSFLSLFILLLGEPLCQFLISGPCGVALFSVACLVIYSILPASHLGAENKAVVITGCDSGFGHALAIKLDSIGMTVFAGFLDVNCVGAIELSNKCSNRLHIVKLDVTSKTDIETVSAYVRDHVRDNGLWGLVNNAGIWSCANLDLLPEKVLYQVMDVNLFGAVRVTRKLAPLIMQAHGRIINVSSILGRMSMEGSGAYAMSKHALVAFTNTLRLEMKRSGSGVRVSIIEPAGFCTGNLQEKTLTKRKEELWENLEDEKKEFYGKEYVDAMYAHVESIFRKFPKDVAPVIRCIRSGLLSKRPRERYPCGTGAETILCLYPFLPVWLADYYCSCVSILPRSVRPQAVQADKIQ